MGKANILSSIGNGKYSITREFKNGGVSGQLVAWCADNTSTLSGDVGTIEIDGESENINIQPGFNNNAEYDSDRDGINIKISSMTPAQAFYNLAMMPGWQKWKPTYRYGTITSISGDKLTASVYLGSVTSRHRGLNINQSKSLQYVPFSYMTCDGQVFEIGDTVVIELTNQSFDNPIIIGFRDNPKGCYYLFDWADMVPFDAVTTYTPKNGNIPASYFVAAYSAYSIRHTDSIAGIPEINKSYDQTKEDIWIFCDFDLEINSSHQWVTYLDGSVHLYTGVVLVYFKFTFNNGKNPNYKMWVVQGNSVSLKKEMWTWKLPESWTGTNFKLESFYVEASSHGAPYPVRETINYPPYGSVLLPISVISGDSFGEITMREFGTSPFKRRGFQERPFQEIETFTIV